MVASEIDKAKKLIQEIAKTLDANIEVELIENIVFNGKEWTVAMFIRKKE